jgi:DNA polymerase-1
MNDSLGVTQDDYYETCSINDLEQRIEILEDHFNEGFMETNTHCEQCGNLLVHHKLKPSNSYAYDSEGQIIDKKPDTVANNDFFWQPGSRPIPPVPPTTWKQVETLPNLKHAQVIALDVEAYDPDLDKKGPGWATKNGHVVGISLAWTKQDGIYLPIRHEFQQELNLNPEYIFAYLNSIMDNKIIIGANLMYDVGWLTAEGVKFNNCMAYDVQIAEALLHEGQPVALESLGQHYLNTGKESNLLYEWLAKAYGGEATGKQRKNIYRAPITLTAPYAISDVTLPLQIFDYQKKELDNLEMFNLFLMECSLIPLLIRMRFEGVKVNVKKAYELYDRFKAEEENIQKRINTLCGKEINVKSPIDMKHIFDKFNFHYEVKPETGNPVLGKKVLSKIDHEVISLIADVKEIRTLTSTFLKKYIMEGHTKGRLHGQFHILKGEKKGTIARFSSSNPNLQNIPKRGRVKKLIRSLFIPEENHTWLSIDYAQVEYRILAHFAVGKGSDKLRQTYADNPDISYHNLVSDLVSSKTGTSFDYGHIKNMNFGLIYGMMLNSLSGMLSISKEATKNLQNAYFKSAPYIKTTMSAVENYVQEKGEIRTLLGRRFVADKWDSKDVFGEYPLPYEQALRQYGSRIKRANLYIYLNRLIQGTAADIMKKAMVDAHKAGIFDAVGYPKMTVHDELNHSVNNNCNKEAIKSLIYVMENTVNLKVPLRVNCEYGPNWGELTGFKL